MAPSTLWRPGVGMKRATGFSRVYCVGVTFRKAQGRPVRCLKPSVVLRRIARRPEGSTSHRNERWAPVLTHPAAHTPPTQHCEQGNSDRRGGYSRAEKAPRHRVVARLPRQGECGTSGGGATQSVCIPLRVGHGRACKQISQVFPPGASVGMLVDRHGGAHRFHGCRGTAATAAM